MRGKTFSGAHMWFYFVACSLFLVQCAIGGGGLCRIHLDGEWDDASSLVSQSVWDLVCGAFASMPLVEENIKWLMLSNSRRRRSINAWQLTGDPWNEEEQRVRQWSDQITFVCLVKSSESVLAGGARSEEIRPRRIEYVIQMWILLQIQFVQDRRLLQGWLERDDDWNSLFLRGKWIHCEITRSFTLRTVFDDSRKCLFETRAVLKCVLCVF